MRVLFVVPYPPSPVRVRPYYLIKELSRRGHRITVATLWTNEEERADVEALRTYCERVFAVRLSHRRAAWNCLHALPTGEPLQARYCWHPELALLVQQLAMQNDIVHVEHLRGVRFGLRLMQMNRAQCGQGPALIWDSVDCISHLFEQAARKSGTLRGRIVTALELNRTRRYEGSMMHRFQSVLVTSPVDRQALRELAAGYGASDWGSTQAKIDVLPNGVDLDYFTPSDEPREPATVVVSGKMSYHANVSGVLYLVREIMPSVWARRPDVKLWIVGKDPPRELRSLPSKEPECSGRVLVTGTVPDLRPYIRRATLAVAPLTYGAGIQNKVLEAMGCATPVLASRRVVAPLSARPGVHLQAAESASEFATALLTLLEDAGLRRRIGRAGRSYVEQHHTWPSVASKLESIYVKARNTNCVRG